MEITAFVKSAIGISDALAHLHARGVVHKNLRPQNIFLNESTGETEITGNDQASDPPWELPYPHDRALSLDALTYMSPEQTGRMNRAVDQRSDLYSLGIILYELATGRCPFSAKDPLEWVYCHLAHLPVPPSQLLDHFSATVSDIIMKLLSKVPEDRYQSAAGLRQDLKRCLTELEKTGNIPIFPIAETDVPDRLQVSQKLYGREQEVKSLLEAFGRVMTTANSELIVVAGYSGVGKSSLIQELQKPIVLARGFFLSGKFEQYKRNVPYAPLIQAFREFVLEILGESQEKIQIWRDRIQAAVGANGKVLTDVIPEVELIIGKQPMIIELSPTESQNRFVLVFQKFISVVATPERPVVLFLDDLQWADIANLKLIEILLTSADAKSFLFLVSYRDNEAPASHPLHLLLANIRKSQVRVTSLELSSLSLASLAQMISDTLRCEADEALPLSRLIHEKTGGNPFFTIQFLKKLNQENLLAFDHQSASWKWDVLKIKEKTFTENIVEFMLIKLKELSPEVRETLSIASCLGNSFDLPTLSIVMDRSPGEITRRLENAIQEGLLIRMGQSCRFGHDRVQQAAYLLIPENERPARHARIGRLLLAGTAENDLEERIFEIVGQFNLGLATIQEEGQRLRVAKLNLLAGKKAKASNAHAPAITHLTAGIDLLWRRASEMHPAADPWEQNYELAYHLHLQRAECEFLSGNFAQAHELLDLLLTKARTKIEKAAVYQVKQDAHLIEGKITQSVDTALECLKLFGIHLSPHPTREELLAERRHMDEIMEGREIEDLVHLPAMTDPEIRAAMQVLALLYSSSFFTDANLFFILHVRMVELSILYGNTAASVQAYAGFGFAVIISFDEFKIAHRFAKLGVALMEKGSYFNYKAKAFMILELTSYWNQPIGMMLPCIRTAQEAAIEIGDLPIAGFSCNHIVSDLLALGAPLDEVYRESEKGIEFVRKIRFHDLADILISIQQFIKNLQGRTSHFSTFTDPSGESEGGAGFGSDIPSEFSEERFETSLLASQMSTKSCWYWILKLQARFLSGDHAEALAAGDKAKALNWSTRAHLQYRDFHVFYALNLAALCDQRDSKSASGERPARLQAIKEHTGEARTWARNCPTNFQHSVALLEAEIARLENDPILAEELYEKSIHWAQKGGFIHDEALAWELAAKFYQRRGMDTIADTYFRQAHAKYSHWGAFGKAKQLESAWPRLAGEKNAFAGPSHIREGDLAKRIDHLSIIKASQTLSGEIVHDRLLKTLVELILSEGGARKGCVILQRDNQLVIEAEGTLRDQGLQTEILGGTEPALASSRVPESIVQYVWRTKERVILEDLGKEGRFAADPYLMRHRPRSVLCLPILRRSEAVGLLYLENDVVPAVFSPDRFTTLELLAAQAAISFENTALFHSSQEAIRSRDEFLSIASHELNTPLTSLILTIQTLRKRQSQDENPDFSERMLETAEQQCQRLKRLIGELLDVTRIQNGRIELNYEKMDLLSLAKESTSRFQQDLIQAGCPLLIRGQSPVIGLWDRSRIEQVISNLLSNSIKFGRGKPIELSVRQENDRAVLSVRDHGIGISPEQQQNLFQRLQRRVSSRHYGGLGLGLYISRRIVEAHGGSIHLRSGPAVGSKFTVELPFVPPQILA